MDVSPEALHKGLKTIASNCDRLIKKDKMTDSEKEKVLAKVRPVTRIDELSDCDFVVEAATENLELKLNIFRDLDKKVKASALLWSNTSSISITKISGVTKRPEKVAGMHFMNPVPLMPLVEGVRGLQTSEETFKQVAQFAESLGKVFVEAKDMHGFIVNRDILPMIYEEVYTFHVSVGSEA